MIVILICSCTDSVNFVSSLSPQCQHLSGILKDSSVSSQSKFRQLVSKGMATIYMIFISKVILSAINFNRMALWSSSIIFEDFSFIAKVDLHIFKFLALIPRVETGYINTVAPL